MSGRTGVLVMAHGTPSTRTGIEAFYTRIRRGHPPSPDQLADLVRRYDAIGGTSPLTERTAAQVAGIAAALEDRAPGAFVVRYGAKHTEPSIEAAAHALADEGIGVVVGLVLTPHESSMGSAEYLARAAAAVEGADGAPRFVPVARWWDAPGFADLVGRRVRDALARLPAHVQRRTVLFTAHSLPQRVVAAGDTYPAQVAASAEAAAEAAGLGTAGVAWEVAWQSAGRTPEPWIGPDVLEVLRRIGADAARAPGGGGPAGVVVCPIGFVADHLEVLYDVDVEAAGVAAAAGLAFARTASLNDDPGMCALVADVVIGAAGKAPGG